MDNPELENEEMNYVEVRRRERKEGKEATDHRTMLGVDGSRKV